MSAILDLRPVLELLVEAHLCREAAVLVTVCAVEGSSMRNPGTVMGVRADGSFAGSLSGGCIEQAVVAEALEVLKEGRPRMQRFGAGSPYLDIKLPCGGGLDLHFFPLSGSDIAAQCLGTWRSRTPFSIGVSPQGAEHLAEYRAPRFDGRSPAGARDRSSRRRWPG